MIPEAYQKLIPHLANVFPSDFDIDLNGKTLAWEAICLIPFVDERKVMALEKSEIREGTLTQDEVFRNKNNFNYKFFKVTQEPDGFVFSPLTNFKA